jgi:catechol 2,3-dioxygenase-like lactoylglutathione lyase family enzyme
MSTDTTATTVVNHTGLCVTDLGRSRAFYENALGFTHRNDLDVDDGPASKLLDVPAPVGLGVVYLTLGTFVLELLSFDREGNAADRTRDFTERGLTHLSFNVADMAATCAAVEANGGTVLRDSELTGVAVMVRDPDGQLLELIQAR